MTESNDLTCSIAYTLMKYISAHISKVASDHYSHDNVMLPTVSHCLLKWSKAIITPVVHMAYVLDPTQYFDEKNWVLGGRAARSTTPEERRLQKEFEAKVLDNWCKDDRTLRETLETQIDDFKEGRGLLFDETTTIGNRVKEKLASIQMPGDLSSPTIRRQRVIDFWRKYGDYVPELQELALVLAFLPVSNAEGERNFSLYGMIIEGRNSMSLEKRTKVLFLLHNMKLSDSSIRKDAAATRQWKQTTAKNYFVKVRKMLSDPPKPVAEYFLLECEMPDEVLDEVGIPRSQPDYVQELKYRLTCMDARVAKGERLSLQERNSYEKMKSVVDICTNASDCADEEETLPVARTRLLETPSPHATPTSRISLFRPTDAKKHLVPRHTDDLSPASEDEDDLRMLTTSDFPTCSVTSRKGQRGRQHGSYRLLP
jgi:hypothetical protein